MMYKADYSFQRQLLSSPETGMGYQYLEGTINNRKGNFVALNAQIIIERDGDIEKNIKKIINEGFRNVFMGLREVDVSGGIRVMSAASASKGAIDGKIEYADGKEVFVRLSAFEDDIRIDKTNKCLKPGSFTTTKAEAEGCQKNKNCNPNDLFSLPNDLKIQWMFYIQPISSDTLQRGIVQPANGYRGGGREIYFEKGTSKNTLIDTKSY